MRRSATILSLCAFLIVACGGCGLFTKKKKMEPYAANTASDPYAPPKYESSSRDHEASANNNDMTASTYDANDSYRASSRSYDNTNSQDYGTYSAPTTMTSAQPTYVATTVTPTAVPASGARYHTVAKGDTLYAIARAYYGDQRRWRDVYEANRGSLPDPNMIRTGQRLLIP